MKDPQGRSTSHYQGEPHPTIKYQAFSTTVCQPRCELRSTRVSHQHQYQWVLAIVNQRLVNMNLPWIWWKIMTVNDSKCWFMVSESLFTIMFKQFDYEPFEDIIGTIILWLILISHGQPVSTIVYQAHYNTISNHCASTTKTIINHKQSFSAVMTHYCWLLSLFSTMCLTPIYHHYISLPSINNHSLLIISTMFNHYDYGYDYHDWPSLTILHHHKSAMLSRV